MQLQIQTSDSTNMNLIEGFKYIYDLARCSKCQSFILLKSTNKLYGTNDDCSCLHEIDVPFIVNTDITFQNDPDTKNIVAKYEDFFVPKEFSWAIIPSTYWDMYASGNLQAVYYPERNNFIIVDRDTQFPIECIYMYQCRRINDFYKIDFMSQLEGFLYRQQFLGHLEVFTNMEQNEAIRKAFDSKKSAGRVLCHLKTGFRDVAFYFYKGLFSLAKADTLDIEIRFDIIQNAAFMVTFKPKKKKNPLKFNTYGTPFSEKIHCMYRNII